MNEWLVVIEEKINSLKSLVVYKWSFCGLIKTTTALGKITKRKPLIGFAELFFKAALRKHTQITLITQVVTNVDICR